MEAREQRVGSMVNFIMRVRVAAVVCTVLLVTTIMAAPAAQAQTLNVVHTFTGTPDGAGPVAGLTLNASGRLYGTTEYGGNSRGCDSSCGTVFKATSAGSGWVETPIYKFTGVPDGANPTARVITGPDGALYGTTSFGGSGACEIGSGGCGTVFKLQPPPTACASLLCPWVETILYSFTSFADGAWPEAEVVFDQAGNIYGSTGTGGNGSCSHGSYSGCGTVFKLTHNSDGSWSKSTIHSFQGGATDGVGPSALVVDQSGNIYGTTSGGGLECSDGGTCGLVFKLTPTGSGWTEAILHFFTGASDGYDPYSGLIFDRAGNLYGTASAGGQGIDSGNGTVFELTPEQGGTWNFSVQYTFDYYNNEANGPGPLTMDAAGNIYGASFGGGAYGVGTVYKLTASNGGWTYTTLYSFGFGDGSAGFFPEGRVALDAGGNIYGTASQGPYPSPDDGTVFQITP
jgi:uncharacterized repeat protein (TIGR03803 family)